MSVWTHVAGIIRVDSFHSVGFPKPDFDKLIGKSCCWNDSGSTWDDYGKNPEKYMPGGSEGALEKSIWDNPDPSDLAAYVVSVWGDLRDFGNEDFDKIKSWFGEVLKRINNGKENAFIRQASILVECEYGDRKMYIANEDDEGIATLREEALQ